MRVHFRNFWPGFEPRQFFVPLLQEAIGEPLSIVSSTRSGVDVEVLSVFEPARPRWVPRLGQGVGRWRGGPAAEGGRPFRIWFTGENLRPPVGDFDVTLSFDRADPEAGNVYLPLAFLGLDWFGDRRYAATSDIRRLGVMPAPQDLLARRPPAAGDRNRFACAFIGQPEPLRLEAIEALRAIGRVDVFGAAAGRPVPSKAEVAFRYRFMVCFENAVYPGYVTEKAVDAWACGCIPLWRGSDALGLFNPDALVNFEDCPDLTSFVATVRDIASDNERYESVRAQPLASSTWSLDAAIALIRDRWARHRGV